MADTIDKIVKELVKVIPAVSKTSPYDTQATVVRVDGNTAWVHIPGGVDETPVQLTTNAKKGDIVQVRVSGGRAWLYGNQTNPPTDDTTAKYASVIASKAKEMAEGAYVIAENAEEIGNNAYILAGTAKASADGKNTIYRGATQPTGGTYVTGDIWFDTAHDNKIYRYNGTSWGAVLLGDDALDEFSANHITAGTIDASQVTVSNLDAGNITTGTLDTDRLNVNDIISTGSIIVNGDNISKLNNNSGYQTSGQVSSAISTVTADMATNTSVANTYATKASAIASTVSVYYRSTTHSTPSISTSTTIGTATNTDNAWEYAMPVPKKNCYFYTCEKYTTVSGAVSFSTVRELASETYASKWVSSSDSTYIDGGSIYASSITSNQINTETITVGSLSDGSSYSTTSQMNTAIGNAVDGIEVGGRNLLYGVPKSNNSTAYLSYELYLSEPLIADTQYTLQLWGVTLDSNSSGIGMYWGGGSNPLDGTNSYSTRAMHPDANGYICRTFTVTSANATHAQASNLWICLYNFVNGHANSNLVITNWKLEKGNKATDYSPAPEDGESEYIVGTHGSTATNVWTGVSKDTAIYTGKTIRFYMTSAGTSTAATLNLTLADGTTTGAKNVRWNNTNVTTHYPQYSVITLTYDGTYWKTAAYNSDTYNRVRMQNVILAQSAITSSRIICGTSSGYKQIGASVAFDVSYPLLFAGSAIEAAATGDNNYLSINGVNASSNGTITSGAANKALYLKGTLNGSTFTIASSGFLTTVVPTTKDNFVYLPIGQMYSATNIYFSSPTKMYAYKGGKFQEVGLGYASAHITEINDNGIKVHADNNTTTNYVQIDSTGMDVVKGGNSVAFYGDTARIGKSGAQRVEITSSNIDLYDSSNTQQLRIGNALDNGLYLRDRGMMYKSYSSDNTLYYGGWQNLVATGNSDSKFGLSAADNGWGGGTEFWAGGHQTSNIWGDAEFAVTHTGIVKCNDIYMRPGRTNKMRSGKYGEVAYTGNTFSLGNYITTGLLTSTAGELDFSFPTGMRIVPGATINSLTFNIVVRAGSSNGTGMYIIKKTSGGSDTAPFNLSSAFSFYNGANTSKSLAAAKTTATIQGNTNIYVSMVSGTADFFSGSSTNTGYINNHPCVVSLGGITVSLSYPTSA